MELGLKTIEYCFKNKEVQCSAGARLRMTPKQLMKSTKGELGLKTIEYCFKNKEVQCSAGARPRMTPKQLMKSTKGGNS